MMAEGKYKYSAEELKRMDDSKRKQEAFPNVGVEEKQDFWVYEYALRRKKDGKLVTRLDPTTHDVYEFGPMGHCPEGYEVVGRTLWPEPWKPLK
jgi:hypothetical protein